MILNDFHDQVVKLSTVQDSKIQQVRAIGFLRGRVSAWRALFNSFACAKTATAWLLVTAGCQVK